MIVFLSVQSWILFLLFVQYPVVNCIFHAIMFINYIIYIVFEHIWFLILHYLPEKQPA
jgi:hypothetical protein